MVGINDYGVVTNGAYIRIAHRLCSDGVCVNFILQFKMFLRFL